MFVVFSWYSGFLYLKILSKVVLKTLTLSRTLNKPESCNTIDWCLMPTLAIFQLYCGVNKLYSESCVNQILNKVPM